MVNDLREERFTKRLLEGLVRNVQKDEERNSFLCINFFIVVLYERIGLGSRLMNETLIYHGPDDARSLACWGMIFHV